MKRLKTIDIKNEVPDEDGIRESVELWKNEDSGGIDPAWLEHLEQLIGRLVSEQAEEGRDMDSELARAYNNLADPCKPAYSELLKKAIALLKPHEEYFAGDHLWNFCMGYSYYCLGQEAVLCGTLKRRWRPALTMRTPRN